MTFFSFRRFPILLAISFVLVGCIVFIAGSRRVDIYYTGSLDGRLDGCTCFGYPTAGLVKTARELRIRNTDNSVLLDTGDVFEAGPNEMLAAELRESYRELGFDAVAAGEQDTSNGLDVFFGDLAAGAFSSQNIKRVGSGTGPSEPVFVRRGDLAVLVITITGEESFSLYPKEFRDKLEILPVDSVIKYSVAKHSDADLFVVLYHGSEVAASEIASRYPKLDAVIFGHEKKLVDVSVSGNVPLYSPGEDGNRIGIVSIHVSPFGRKTIKNRFILFDYLKDVDDTAIRTRVMRYNDYFVRTTGLERDVEASPGSGAKGIFEFSYFYSPNCRSCLDFLGKRIPEASRETSILIKAHKRNIMDPAEMEALDVELGKRGLSGTGFPVIVSENGILQGEEEIRAHFTELVRGEQNFRTDLGVKSSAEKMKKGGSPVILPVMAAALLDGINPCAFTTIIFLLSSLAVAGRGRKQILLIGACFTGSVFITYTAIGLGAFALLRAGSLFPFFSALMRYGMVAVLTVFSVLSAIDFFRVRSGNADTMILQLPVKAKLRIHAAIRNQRHSGGLIVSSILMGALVAAFELGCTGQVYLPTIIYIVKSEQSLRGYGYLVLYNLFFVFPLLLVFISSYLGMNNKTVSNLFSRYLGTVKAATAVLFACFAVLLIL